MGFDEHSSCHKGFLCEERALVSGCSAGGAGSRLRGSVGDELTGVPPQRASAFFRGDSKAALGTAVARSGGGGERLRVQAAGKHLRHFALRGAGREECARSLVLKCVFKIKGFTIATMAETTADENNFLESRVLHES